MADETKVTSTDVDKSELPVRTPDYDGGDEQVVGKALDHEEHMDLLSDRMRNPVDLTEDSLPDRQRDWAMKDKILSYDPVIHETPKNPDVELDAATWDDLRALNAPPPQRLAGERTYVCIQHPNMIVCDPNTTQPIVRFKDGYVVTNDVRIQKVLEHPSQRYIKRLDMKV